MEVNSDIFIIAVVLIVGAMMAINYGRK